MAYQKKKNKGGRPERITPDILAKLELAFTNAFPDTEACLYAGINPATLYRYQEKHPGFSERKELLKLHPNMAARQTIVKALNDVRVAQWFLEKKDPEYRPVSKVEHSGKIQLEAVASPAILEAVRIYEETREKQIRAEARAILTIPATEIKQNEHKILAQN